ncbi:hypothetical protein ACOSQ3_020032 [Xanthoceras sorbifolium]
MGLFLSLVDYDVKALISSTEDCARIKAVETKKNTLANRAIRVGDQKICIIHYTCAVSMERHASTTESAFLFWVSSKHQSDILLDQVGNFI